MHTSREPETTHIITFAKVRDLLWPFGATVLGLWVVPIAIEQYPEVFKESPWILPLGVAVVCLCWLVPLFLHDRVRRMHGWMLGRLGPRLGWTVALIVVFGLVGLIIESGYKLYGSHKRHLEVRLKEAERLATKPMPEPQPKPEGTRPLEKIAPGLRKPHIGPVPTLRPYDLAGERRAEFLNLLKPPTEPDTLRIGCTAWSERACVAAGHFLVLLSEAGWKIEENRVFRLEPQIPSDAVFVVGQPEPGAPLPPHLGRWHRLNNSQMTLTLAFTQMGLAPTGSTDASLGEGVTGIYFGPEPPALKVDKQRLLVIQLMKFEYEAAAIEQRFSASHDATAMAREESEWAKSVEDWLRTNSSESAAIRFRNSHGVEGKEKFLSTFAEQQIQAEKR